MAWNKLARTIYTVFGKCFNQFWPVLLVKWHITSWEALAVVIHCEIILIFINVLWVLLVSVRLIVCVQSREGELKHRIHWLLNTDQLLRECIPTFFRSPGNRSFALDFSRRKIESQLWKSFPQANFLHWMTSIRGLFNRWLTTNHKEAPNHWFGQCISNESTGLKAGKCLGY